MQSWILSGTYEYTCEKASTCTAQARVVTNAGTRQTCRLLISRVVSCSLLYAIPIWGTTLHVLGYAHNLSATYRGTVLKVCSAFRTISNDMTLVILGMMPINILTDVLMTVYNIQSISPLLEAKKPKVRDTKVDGNSGLNQKRVFGLTCWFLP